jgi:hypothetical protein
MSTPPRSPLTDATVRAALATGLDGASQPRVERLSTVLANAFGPTAVALIHYGSHAHGAGATAESAHDFLAIVDSYGDAYHSLAATVGTRYRPRVAALLNRVLPPNVIAIIDADATPPVRAKIAVFSLRAFRRACSPRAADLFVRGRLFQVAKLAWVRDEESRLAVVAATIEARAGSFEWGRAFLPPAFDVETYCRTLLTTAFASEIRPETADRIASLLDAQRTTLHQVYIPLLTWLQRAGMLRQEGALYSTAARHGFWRTLKSSIYIRRSKLRATLRWAKYVALYDDWLDYVVRKIARRSGVAIELSSRERRWPLIFLWPKAIRFLRSRPQRQG